LSSRGSIHITVNELDRFKDSARCHSLPNLSKPSAAQAFEKFVSRDRFSICFQAHGHVRVLTRQMELALNRRENSTITIKRSSKQTIPQMVGARQNAPVECGRVTRKIMSLTNCKLNLNGK